MLSVVVTVCVLVFFLFMFVLMSPDPLLSNTWPHRSGPL